MEGFEHILNWKLKRGSHPFPGKNGGTCINEAALVAAGFEYRPIRQPEDMPGCFSRPICALAMRLNDMAGNRERQRLLPFVTRLACADTPEVEGDRAAYIALRTARGVSFDEGLDVLKAALAIGRQVDGLVLSDVRSRMVAVQRTAAAKPAWSGELNLFSKLKDWFGATKQPEPTD